MAISVRRPNGWLQAAHLPARDTFPPCKFPLCPMGNRRGHPLWPLLGAIGVGSVAWGGFLMVRKPPPIAGTASQSPAPPVRPPSPSSSIPGPAGMGSGVWTGEAPTEAKSAAGDALCPDCDVVILTMCSVRRDHISAYGLPAGALDGQPLTPQLDALMAGGFRMEQAWSASNFTLAGLTAVLTGRFGSTTGVTGWDKGLVEDVPTLPEVLGYYGYRTGAFTIDAPSGFRPDYGLDRGFQHMEITPAPRDTPDGRSRGGEIGPGGAAARPAAAWIRAQAKDQPIFAMLHTRAAHFPFVIEDDPSDETGVTSLLWGAGGAQAGGQAMPGTAGGTAQRGVVSDGGPDPVQVGVRAAGDAGIAMWKRRYAEGLRRLDADVAVIAAALKARGRLDKTIVLVLADHGESLNDHGELLHGDAYFDGVVHIPMLARVPGLTGRPLSALTSQVDILPTVLELVGAVTPAGIDGASMVPLYTGERDAIRSTTLVEGGVSWREDGAPRGAVISLPWTLLTQDQECGAGGPPRGHGGRAGGAEEGEPAVCLFDLTSDPGQMVNVALAHLDVVADLQSRWEKFRAAHAEEGATLKLDPAFVKELQRTGYNFRPGEE